LLKHVKSVILVNTACHAIKSGKIVTENTLPTPLWWKSEVEAVHLSKISVPWHHILKNSILQTRMKLSMHSSCHV